MNRHAILVVATFAAMPLGIARPAGDVADGLTGTWTEVGTPDENKAVVQGTIAYFDSPTARDADKTLHLKGRVLDLPDLDRPRSEAHLHA